MTGKPQISSLPSKPDKEQPTKHDRCVEEMWQKCPLLYKECLGWRRGTVQGVYWDCGSGWDTALTMLSYKLEALNLLFFPKFRIRIVAQQIKEKFGTLRFYFTVADEAPFMYRFLAGLARSAGDWILNAFNFKMENRVLRPAFSEYLAREEKAQPKFTASNVKYCHNCNFTYSITDQHRYQLVQYVPTRKKLLYKISSLLRGMASRIESAGRMHTHPSAEVVTQYMYEQAQAMVMQAEKDCFGLCERCGAHIGEKRSPRCETTGWVTYICKKCADAAGNVYYIGEEKYANGQKIDVEKDEKR